MKLLIKVPVYLTVEVVDGSDVSGVSNEVKRYFSMFGSLFADNFLAKERNQKIGFINTQISKKLLKGHIIDIQGVCEPYEQMRNDYEIIHPNSKFNEYL